MGKAVFNNFEEERDFRKFDALPSTTSHIAPAQQLECEKSLLIATPCLQPFWLTWRMVDREMPFDLFHQVIEVRLWCGTPSALI